VVRGGPLTSTLVAVAALALYLAGPRVAPGAVAEKASIPSKGPCAYLHPSDQRISWTCRSIARGETHETLFGDSWRAVARFNRIDRRHVRPGTWIKGSDRLAELPDFTPIPQHYAPADSEARFILIDLTEQFLGAYEYGTLVLSAPLATGRPDNPTPTGDFRIDAADLKHRSSRYTIAKTGVRYPMHYGLRFLRTPRGVSYWIHGRYLPGYPASHGCVGLYDEAMQARYYGEPKRAELDDARRLFEWAVGPLLEGQSVRENLDGPRVRVVGRAPRRGEAPATSQSLPNGIRPNGSSSCGSSKTRLASRWSYLGSVGG